MGDVVQEWAMCATGFDREEEKDRTCEVSEAIPWLLLAKQLCSQGGGIPSSSGGPCAWISTCFSKGRQFPDTGLLIASGRSKVLLEKFFHQQVHSDPD